MTICHNNNNDSYGTTTTNIATALEIVLNETILQVQRAGMANKADLQTSPEK